MRGEFIGVWPETWREIWEVVAAEENVPDDLFCELYRELTMARKAPSPDEALANVLNDAIQRREVFNRALIIADLDIDIVQRDKLYDDLLMESLESAEQRKGALDHTLLKFIDNPAKSTHALAQALTEFVNDPVKRAETLERALESTINDKQRSMKAFEHMRASELAGERALVSFLEAAQGILEELGGDRLSNLYFNLLADFIDKYNLRYDLRRPCTLCPTLPGMFASLVRDLRALTSQDAHLDSLMKEFEDAVRDLRYGCSDGRIKTCISKQFMLLEAMGSICPGVTKGTLGDMCDQVGSWPHAAIRESLKKLYGFASDYPGIRHGKNRKGMIRTIEMRDLVAMSILLAGFTPYLTDLLNADTVYRGN